MGKVDSSCRLAQVGDKVSSEDIWGNLLEEGLAQIFRLLPFETRLRVVPQVCKSWQNASLDPACWNVVDMGPWLRSKIEEDLWWEFGCEAKVDHLVKIVVARSRGQLRELRTMHVSDDAIDFIAERCPSLVVLFIPNSLLVTDKSAEKLAMLVPGLKQLDVSDCHNISEQALEAFGRNCPSLTWLGRNMLNLDYYNDRGAGSSGSSILPRSPGGDQEAEVVSKHMGRLRHLEMKKTRLSDRGLRHLVTGCRELENLDLACCTSLSPQALDDASRNSPRLRRFNKPITPRMYVNHPTVSYDD